ncbi:MFS transporter [Nonomuraea dietziae]|uniref:EmrB/QacA subfamily drug resistance transporter n=2 Tax=Nonomuraea dietziae TaxID=65515 RepID=A0A7W5Y8T0_9ACTN|nr:MFS transporter [Nonomuraea dietziae]MBB3724928.1 EmrB/QacA subfamily drug resistance transporter [Nonomuraea dietziae]
MRPGRQRHLTLTCSVTGAVIVALDGTVLTITQPALQRDLHASFAQVQWTSTGYLIAVAALLVLAGRVGDRYGHREVFAAGTLGFAATSAAIALAPDIGWVIGLRVAQGIFGALLQPATLGMLRAAFPADRLPMAIAARSSAIGLAAAAGPLVGGALTAHFGWRSVFLLNVAPALAIGVAALAVRVPAPRSTGAGTGTGTKAGGRTARLGLTGACLLASALACLVHTLVELPRTGWTVGTALGLTAAVAAGGAFVQHQRVAAHPLIPRQVLASRPLTAALAVLLAASAAMFGALFVGSYFLQEVLALDPLQSGLRVLPLAVMMVVAAPVTAVLLRRQGPRRTALTALALVSSGMVLLAGADRSAASPAMAGAFLLLGAGFGTVMVTATAVVVQQASTDDVGVSGGLKQTIVNIGPALGIALATTSITLIAPGLAGDGASRWTAAAFGGAMGPTLLLLAGVAALGVPAALRLPSRAAADPVSRT